MMPVLVDLMKNIIIFQKILCLHKVMFLSKEWIKLLSEDIPKDELEIFDSVLMRMQEKARDIIKKQEEDK